MVASTRVLPTLAFFDKPARFAGFVGGNQGFLAMIVPHYVQLILIRHHVGQASLIGRRAYRRDVGASP